MKCPKCGSEYFSDSDLCYSCGLKRDDSGPARPQPSVRKVLVVPALGLLGIGTFLVAYAALLVRMGDAPPSTDWTGIAYSGAALASFGIGLATYSVIGHEMPIWEVRNGRRQTNKRAAGAISAGITIMFLVLGYLAAAIGVEEHSVSFEWIMVALLVSAVSLAIGVLEVPATLLGVKNQDNAAWPYRRKHGLIFIASGLSIQAGTYVYGYERYAGYDLMLGSIIVGVVMVLVGITILNGPSPRPWVWTGERR